MDFAKMIVVQLFETLTHDHTMDILNKDFFYCIFCSYTYYIMINFNIHYGVILPVVIQVNVHINCRILLIVH